MIAFMVVAISFTGCKKEELLTLSPTSQTLIKDAGSFTINVTSNTSWTVVADQSWCTVGTASGEDNGTITVTYQENATESSRSGNITVTTKDGMIQVVSVSQAGIPPVSNPLIGTWKRTGPSGDYELFVFNADMTGQNKYIDEYGEVEYNDSYTYEKTETSIIFHFPDTEPVAGTYVISGSELELTIYDVTTVYSKQ